MSTKTTPTKVTNPTSYGIYHENMGPELAGLPNKQQRYTLEVEFILDMVPGAWHQPEDLVKYLLDHPYITSVTYDKKGD